MKNWKISLAAVLGLLLIASAAFAKGALDKVPMYSKHEGSKKAQQQLNEEMLNLLKTKQFKKLEDLYYNLPQCSDFKSGVLQGKIPTRCDDGVKLYDEPNHVITVTVYKDEEHSLPQDSMLLNVVSPDKAFYYALTKYYISLYGKDPSVLDAKKYSAFYKLFVNSGLNDRVRNTMVLDWQGGKHLPSLDLDTLLSQNVGAPLYDSVNTAMIMGVKNPEELYTPIPWEGLYYRPLVDYYPRILNQIYGRGKALNNLAPFYRVKTYWFNTLLKKAAEEPCRYHETPFRLYYVFGDKDFDAWKTYAISPITSQQKQWVKKMVDSCYKAKKEKQDLPCGLLKERAIKYGYLAKSQQEVKADIKKALNSNSNSKHPRADANGHIGPIK